MIKYLMSIVYWKFGSIEVSCDYQTNAGFNNWWFIHFPLLGTRWHQIVTRIVDSYS